MSKLVAFKVEILENAQGYPFLKFAHKINGLIENNYVCVVECFFLKPGQKQEWTGSVTAASVGTWHG